MHRFILMVEKIPTKICFGIVLFPPLVKVNIYKHRNIGKHLKHFFLQKDVYLKIFLFSQKKQNSEPLDVYSKCYSKFEVNFLLKVEKVQFRSRFK